MTVASYLELGGVEIANHARLQAYIDAGLPMNFDSLEACGCSTITAASLGHVPYLSPGEDPAPWYDPAAPESADFLGLLVLSVNGMERRPTTRKVSQIVTGGGALGRRQVQPRTLAIQGVLVGGSCCSLRYGLSWLGQVLDGCSGGGCEGDSLVTVSCCPDEEPEDLLLEYGRTLRRVALIEGPTVTRSEGRGCGVCQGDVAFVEIVLVAAEPWLYRPPVPVLDESIPTDDGSECVEWTLVEDGCPGDEECCRNAVCDEDSDCVDPSCRPPDPPSLEPAASCFCLPLATNDACFTIDTSFLPESFEAVPIVTLSSGTGVLRRVTVTMYDASTASSPGDCDEAALEGRCDPLGVYHAGYLPSQSTMTFDGQVRRVEVECGGEPERASDAWGRDGGPVEFVPLGCGRTYCVCISSDGLAPPADDATVTIELSAREG